jgi:hypothetical protein
MIKDRDPRISCPGGSYNVLNSADDKQPRG